MTYHYIQISYIHTHIYIYTSTYIYIYMYTHMYHSLHTGHEVVRGAHPRERFADEDLHPLVRGTTSTNDTSTISNELLIMIIIILMIPLLLLLLLIIIIIIIMIIMNIIAISVTTTIIVRREVPPHRHRHHPRCLIAIDLNPYCMLYIPDFYPDCIPWLYASSTPPSSQAACMNHFGGFVCSGWEGFLIRGGC